LTKHVNFQASGLTLEYLLLSMAILSAELLTLFQRHDTLKIILRSQTYSLFTRSK